MVRTAKAVLSSARLVSGLLALAAGSTVVWLLVVALAPALLGWQPSVLTSDSMAPALRAGDVVVAAPTGEALSEGAVIVFDEPGGGRVSHRVVGVNPDGTYVTRGDANPGPDSTPVPHERVVGQGRLMVPMIGLPYVWWTTGRWGHVAATGAAGAAIAGLGWVVVFGRRRRSRIVEVVPPAVPAPAPAPTRSPRRWAFRLAAVPATAAMLFSLVYVVPAVSGLADARAAFSANAANGGSSFAAAASFADLYYLKTVGSGNTTSTPILPLGTTAPTATILPNYDTDRDSAPGLLVKKGQYQIWELTPSTDLSIAGPTQLHFWSAMKNFNTSKKGVVSVGLLDCADASWSFCEVFAWSTLAPSTAWSGGSSTWVEKTADLGALDRTIAAGRVLRLAVSVDSTSGDDMLFAYDTTAYPSRLEVG